jgi:3',5'-cyclic AMP phosphodiesterase CpdA
VWGLKPPVHFLWHSYVSLIITHRMKFIHFGDIHVWRYGMLWSEFYYPKRWLGLVNLCLNRSKHFPPEYHQAALDEILREQPDVAIFTGDFSSLSLKSEFKEAARLFAPLREKLGERLFAIPGNHDVYTAKSARTQVMERTLPWVHSETVSRLDLNDRLTLLGVNHAEPFLIASNGRVTSAIQTALRQAFEQTKAERRQVILAGHFPYVNLPEYPESKDHQLLNRDLFRGLIQEMKPAVYLHGHQHIRWAIRTKDTADTLCLNCGSVSMKHESPDKQAGFLSWDQQADGSFRNLTAHTYNGKDTWAKSPIQIREI